MYKNNFNTEIPVPQAFVTCNKQRLKQHDKIVYLDNNSTFELELFNPTKITVLAKIKLNGNYISGGGVVVKPGQRIFLERYLDDNKKFLFETYEVNGTSTEVLNAIQNNGDVIIEFYNERIKNMLTINNSPIMTYSSNTVTNIPTMTYSSNTVTNIPTMTYSSNTVTDLPLNTTSTFIDNTYNLPTLSSIKHFSRSETIETGRIEKGGNSNQKFTEVNMDFLTYYNNVCNWKIKPTSTKVYESTDINVFCHECGTKRKKQSFKFCPNCGTKF